MTRTYETILWERDGGVGTLTINRPEQFNGMTTRMLRETHELLHDVADDETLTVSAMMSATGRTASMRPTTWPPRASAASMSPPK